MNNGASILGQDEIDALLSGVEGGGGATEPPPAAPGEVRPHDLATQTRIVRGRMPTLEMINSRFARLLRIGLFNLIRPAALLEQRQLELPLQLLHLHGDRRRGEMQFVCGARNRTVARDRLEDPQLPEGYLRA